jgi:surfactin synthase thioesterase subunit
MKALILVVALLVLVLAPLLWLVALPFALVGVVLGALLAFVKALLFLPARILGYRG